MALRMLGMPFLILLLSVTSAFAQAKTPDVTDTEVVLDITTPLSGPAAAWGTTGLAAEAWAKHVNDQGGVHGRKIRIVMKDDGYIPGRAVANVTDMKDSVFAIVGLLGTAVMNASKDIVGEAKIHTIYPYGDPQIWMRLPKDKQRYVFAIYTNYVDEGDFIVQQAAKIVNAKKIAIFYQNDDYGKGYVEGVKRAIQAMGGKVALAADVPHEVQDRELGAHALSSGTRGPMS
jgi:branched-chain amino acid transport system substrate-binding protein